MVRTRPSTTVIKFIPPPQAVTIGRRSASPGVLILLLAAVIPLGYFLRFTAWLPDFVRDASGGAMYVVAAALCFAIARPAASPAANALAAFAATSAVEFLQLWHPAWLEAIRGTLPGRLILGTTFSWGDFPPYAAGAIAAWAVLRSAKKPAPPLAEEAGLRENRVV